MFNGCVSVVSRGERKREGGGLHLRMKIHGVSKHLKELIVYFMENFIENYDITMLVKRWSLLIIHKDLRVKQMRGLTDSPRSV